MLRHQAPRAAPRHNHFLLVEPSDGGLTGTQTRFFNSNEKPSLSALPSDGRWQQIFLSWPMAAAFLRLAPQQASGGGRSVMRLCGGRQTQGLIENELLITGSNRRSVHFPITFRPHPDFVDERHEIDGRL